VAQHLLDCGKLARRILSRFLLRELVLFRLRMRSESMLPFHSSVGFFKKDCESFARAMKFAPDCIGCLVGERSYLLVTELFISDQE
jgi:hypothetical protein